MFHNASTGNANVESDVTRPLQTEGLASLMEGTSHSPGIVGVGSKVIIKDSSFHVHPSEISSSGGMNQGFQTLFNNSAPAAAYNSNDRYDPPKCHPKTRTGLLRMVNKWVDGYDDPSNSDCSRIFWLHGSAGAGKSAIAQTMSERLSASNNLAASFFFSRTAPNESHRNHESRFVTTIAYQLAEEIPRFKEYISRAVVKRPAALHLTLSDQVTSLILQPMQHVMQEYPNRLDIIKALPRIVIVDGLDECSGEIAQHQVLDSIATLVGYQDIFPFAVFLASRPETQIQSWFSATEPKFPGLLRNVSLLDECEVDSDIEAFITHEIAEIRRSHPFKHRIPADWPSLGLVYRLVERSNGQFIYASTVLKYINDHRHYPHKRLDSILNNTVPENDQPYAELDALYLNILQKVQYPQEAHRVLSMYLVCEQCDDIRGLWSVASEKRDHLAFVESFLDLSCPLDALMMDLQSVVVFDDANWEKHPLFQTIAYLPLRFHHASFQEYLLDFRRCTPEFFVDLTTQVEHMFIQGLMEFCDILLLHYPLNDVYKHRMESLSTFLVKFLRPPSPHIPSHRIYGHGVTIGRYEGSFSNRESSGLINGLTTVSAPHARKLIEQCYQRLDRAGLPRQLFYLTCTGILRPISHLQHDLSPPLPSDGVPSRSMDSDQLDFCLSLLECHISNLYGNINGQRLLEPPNRPSIELLTFCPTEHMDGIRFYLDHIHSLLDPEKYSTKPKKIKDILVHVEVLFAEYPLWRLGYACRLIDRVESTLFCTCPISSVIISSVHRLFNSLVPMSVIRKAAPRLRLGFQTTGLQIVDPSDWVRIFRMTKGSYFVRYIGLRDFYDYTKLFHEYQETYEPNPDMTIPDAYEIPARQLLMCYDENVVSWTRWAESFEPPLYSSELDTGRGLDGAHQGTTINPFSEAIASLQGGKAKTGLYIDVDSVQSGPDLELDEIYSDYGSDGSGSYVTAVDSIASPGP
ncbi:hypothetical protein CVT24_009496 [Panaeolus cyanescens]|uniref:Nephrocystin 3-like N-terminal domain-containing protein n=1 Tax=Panaeolus cyanescens TaxID=181874 RepID=A0A409VE73_9AGAR|nr:hypothetical protein CVT24_009496 [Panaeolus cyanescens]